MRTLAVVLKDQAEKQEQDDEIIQVEEETPPGKIKPFRLNVTLKPRDFTQSYRTAKAISFSKPRTVAPIAAKARRGDIFHQLDLNPLSFTTHPAILASFVSEMGLVYPRTITQLTPKNQRAISRAIRRAKMMGIIPSLSRPV
ncbi:hypothetical protein BDQ17DRAFT_287566 [Cyathus striatus]|nr:hypothetical protein BDQ17DRAFT_287566 [Cyathus striatus]